MFFSHFSFRVSAVFYNFHFYWLYLSFRTDLIALFLITENNIRFLISEILYISLVKRYFISLWKKYPSGNFDNGFGIESTNKTVVNFCEN